MRSTDSRYTFRYRPYSKALYYALQDDPFYVALERSLANEEASRELMFRYLDYSMVEAERFGELFVPEEHQYGVSVWSRPLTAETEQQKKTDKHEFLLTHMGDASERLYSDVVGFMSSKAATVTDERYWYLSIVGVLPEFQGQGLGAGLVRAVLDKADRLGVPTYLETFTPRNERFYERLGFRSAASFVEPVIGSRYSILTRNVGRS